MQQARQDQEPVPLPRHGRKNKRFFYSPKQEFVLNSSRQNHLNPGTIPAFGAMVGSGWKHSLEVGSVGIPLGGATLGAKT